MAGCGGSSDGLPPSTEGGSGFGNTTGGGGTGGGTTEPGDPVATTLTITADPTTVAIGDISNITVTVLDENGNPMPDGTSIELALSNDSLGTIAGSTSTINGTGSTIFSAGDTPGVVNISASAGTVTGSVTITILGPATITLTINPATITVGGTANISAEILDQNGDPMPDGTTVDFELTNDTIGTLSRTTSSTSVGIATNTFTAGLDPGSTSVIARAGATAIGTAVVSIVAATNGSIEFTSAEPSVIGIQGSGQVTSSVITFTVRDVNGNPVTGADVSFVMSGPSGGKLPANGGEYIGSLDATPTTASSSTVDGAAVVILNAGRVAGPVVITASTSDGSNGTISSASSPISIGGGVPSATHFTLATTRKNLPGYEYVNFTADISAFIADRFGNYNVLEGTSISFYSEAGAIDRNAHTGEDGSTVVTFRTQNPMPGIVAPDATENVLCQSYETLYGIEVYDNANSSCYTNIHPRNSWVTIMASVRGEESFIDTNGNGIYDDGTYFTDSPDEAFIDVNDDGVWNDGPNAPGPDERELFIDDDGDGQYDGLNSVWDADKTIFKRIVIQFTGSPAYIALANLTDGTQTVGYVPDGGSKNYRIIVADQNLNPLSMSTNIGVNVSSGAVHGLTTATLPDIAPRYGANVLSFSVTGGDGSGSCVDEPLYFDVTVTHEGVDYLASFQGTICP